MKKAGKKIVCVFAVTLMIIIIFLQIYAIYRVGVILLVVHIDRWGYNVDFENYADDFESVKDYLVEEFSDEPIRYLYISNMKDEGLKIYDGYENKYLEFPEDISSSLISLEKAFHNKGASFD
jgi:hypothetical protein